MNILIVDDHPIVRQGVRYLLTSQIPEATVQEADGIGSALSAASACRPDVAIIDLSLGRESGLELVARLKETEPATRCLVLSVFDESLHAERALRAGARGYVMKESAPDRLVESVLGVARGEIVVSPQVQTRMLSAMAGQRAEQATGEASLSPREAEVLRLIGEGLTTQQIAARLHRSVKTIEAHRSNLQRKLGLGCALQLVRYATLWVVREGRA